MDSEVGPVILDTRDFDSVLSTKLILIYIFTSESSDYQERARERFLFGESVPITQNDIPKSIMSLMLPDRKVIFIGPDIQHNSRAFLGFA